MPIDRRFSIPAATERGLEGRPSMDRTTAGERAVGTPPDPGEAIEFVRFCHRRRHVGWPELYDEMCAVAGRGLYRGYGPEELSSIGIGFGLFQMPALAELVARVVAEDVERRRRTAEAVRAGVDGRAIAVTDGPPVERRQAPGPEPIEAGHPDHGVTRVAAAAGA
jgi:hypothetical protein